MEAQRSTALEGMAFVLAALHILILPVILQSDEYRWTWPAPAVLAALYFAAGILRNRPPHRRIVPRVLIGIAALVTMGIAALVLFVLKESTLHIT